MFPNYRTPHEKGIVFVVDQIVTRYDDGTLTVANGSRTERLRLAIEGRSLDLPPNAFWGRSGDGKVEIDSSRSRYEPGN